MAWTLVNSWVAIWALVRARGNEGDQLPFLLHVQRGWSSDIQGACSSTIRRVA
jgi:hypothetical protein